MVALTEIQEYLASVGSRISSRTRYGSAPPLLGAPVERYARLGDLGAQIVVVQPFDRQFADQTPDEFLGRVCAGRRMVALVMTAESAFGRDRTGMLPRVRQLAATMAFDVLEVAPGEHVDAPDAGAGGEVADLGHRLELRAVREVNSRPARRPHGR